MVEVTFPAGMDLAELNTLVAHLERADGALCAMRHDGKSTLLTFDGNPKYEKHSVIQPDGTPPPPALRVCSGAIFIAGKPTQASAWRQP
ncbi:MAG TPA: hypothetical protein VMH86_03820 [Rhizomicrobium sp.]|nr:hypothetical protein [Rhizomicrobium sp.]